MSRWPGFDPASCCSRAARTALWINRSSMLRRHNSEEPFMNRRVLPPLRLLVLVIPFVVTACSAGSAKTKDQPSTPAAISVAPTAAVEQPIARYIRATGTLMAEEQADVAAETAGRVVSAPVERGPSVRENAELIRLSSTETDAQAKEAEDNAPHNAARPADARPPPRHGHD